MNNSLYIIILFLTFSCKNEKSNEFYTISIPKHYTLKSSKQEIIKNDVLYIDEERYSGYIYEMFPNSNDTLSIQSYFNGKLSGVLKKWYTVNQLKEERYYFEGKKNGKQIAYWENGNKKFEFTAKNDAYEGELKEWSFDGKLSHLGNFVKGQEEGIQKLWYDTGKIRANYVIKNGKRYGLLGTKNCKNVSTDSLFTIN